MGPRLLAVFVGGCAGGLGRYLLTRDAARGEFPWATLWVNLSGAFLLALLLVVLLEVLPASPYWRPLLGTGFLGAWTTFSGIVVPVDQLVRDGHVGLGAAYLAASLLGGVGAGVMGLSFGRLVTRSVR